MESVADPAALAAAPAHQAAGTPAGRHGKIADIEMLRGFAVIYVLIEHSRLNLFTWVGGQTEKLYIYGGFQTGVDLFFAISGFVIARSLLPTLARAPNRTAYFNATLSFWVRRAWRLTPSAWLWLAVCLFGSVFLNGSHAWGTFRANFEGTIAAMLDIANFRIVHVFARYEAGATFPYWSLSLEEQFYILLPLIVLAAGRWLPWVLGAAVLSQTFLTRSGLDATQLGLLLNQTRSDALLLGVLIAIWSRKPTYALYEPTFLRQNPGAGLFLLGFLLVALAAVGSDRLHIISFPFGVVALVAAILVWVASYDRDYLLRDGPAKRFLIWVGARSYALYLIHIPAYYMAREIWFRIEPHGTIFGPQHMLRIGLTALAILLVLVELNYRLVEVPLRIRGARIADRLARRTIEPVG